MDTISIIYSYQFNYSRIMKYFYRSYTVLFILSFVCNIAAAQFIDNFDKDSPTEMHPEGWTYFSGDGTASMDFVQHDGFASIEVDARTDQMGIWWALIKRHVTGIDLNKLIKPEYELRVEARIKVSSAPKRVNLHFNNQRTTDFHTHLMEYEIPDTTNWHVISMTTHNFDTQMGDSINVQMALMDWGRSLYRVDIDYLKVDVVDREAIEKDLGNPLPYHPVPADPGTYTNHLKVDQDATVDTIFKDMNFNNWQTTDKNGPSILLTVSGTQIVILHWDLVQFKGMKVTGSGLLELTAHNVQRSPDFQKDFGMVRVVEILNGPQDWNQEGITFNSFCRGKPLGKVINTQMIIDDKVNDPAEGFGKTYSTITQPVLQRLIDGKSTGIAIRPLGAVNASFYAMENEGGKYSAILHFNVIPETRNSK